MVYPSGGEEYGGRAMAAVLAALLPAEVVGRVQRGAGLAAGGLHQTHTGVVFHYGVQGVLRLIGRVSFHTLLSYSVASLGLAQLGLHGNWREDKEYTNRAVLLLKGFGGEVLESCNMSKGVF